MSLNFKPDLENYVLRLGALQQLAVPESMVSTSPSAGSPKLPYWLNFAGAARSKKRSSLHREYGFRILSVLIRANQKGGFSNANLEAQILQDMVDIMEYFEEVHNLTSASYTTPQPGFVPNSLECKSTGRFETSSAQGAQLVGSTYEFTWIHQAQISAELP